MRHEFLLDENLLYHAVRGVDEHNKPDITAAELIGSIGRICHVITIHSTLLEKYWHILQKLLKESAQAFEPVGFITRFMEKSEKRKLEFDDLPKLPPDIAVPIEDEWLVRAALISRPIIVTADEELREAIRRHTSLDLLALSPAEALEFATHEPD